MFRQRFLLLSALVIGVCYALGGMPRSTPVAHAETLGATPGQLTILNKQGRPAGVCPLKHTDVQVDIAGYVSRVTVQQQFHNPTNSPIEACYTFPLPEDAAVDAMTMTIGNRVIKGQILRQEEAHEVYEAAKAEGKAAALLDQERPNIFTQSVANIMPGDDVRITISYVALLKYQEGHYNFVFPMVVGPRYTPGGGYRTPGQRGDPSPEQHVEGDLGAHSVVTDADKITPPITPPGTRAGHDISLTVHLDAGLPLQEVVSVLHPVSIEHDGSTRAVIRLQNQSEIPNKDFILRYSAAGSQLQSGMLTYAPGSAAGGYFTMIVQPPMAPPQGQITPKEMVFVIDQTGSQAGWPIAKAKETMRYCIRNMNPGDTFQLLGFNTNLYPCFPAPVHNTPANVAKALKFLEPLEGQGGTDILKSVDYALKIPDDPDRLRIVCYMTDGYVGNDMQIIDYIRKNRGRARMFPFGVGNSVNRFLIEGMAREGRGASDYVTLDESGEAAAATFYRRIAKPLLLDVHVDWGGLPVENVYPRQIPDVFTSGPIILKGRYTRAGEGDITVHGLLRGRPWSQTIHVVFPAVKRDSSEIATLWAREKIEDLQSEDWIGAQTGRPRPEIKDQIVATALEYQLMSQYTSFVAVEQKVVNVGGQSQTVDVPVEMPEGVSYEGIFGEVDAGVPLRSGAVVGRVGHVTKADQRFWKQRSQSTGGMAAVGNGPVTLGAVAASSSAATEALSEKDDEIAIGTKAGEKRLAALSPEARRTVLERAKLAPALRTAVETFRKLRAKDPHVKAQTVEIQIWLNRLLPGELQKLKSLGFALGATLLPNRLLLGTITVDRLDALSELTFVRHIEPPKLK